METATKANAKKKGKVVVAASTSTKKEVAAASANKKGKVVAASAKKKKKKKKESGGSSDGGAKVEKGRKRKQPSSVVAEEEEEEEEVPACDAVDANNDNDMTEEQRALADEYQEKTQHEHILERPDSYVGSVVADDQEVWLFDPATNLMERTTLNIVPGLLHIVDELLVNVGDAKYTDPTVSKLCVTMASDAEAVAAALDARNLKKKKKEEKDKKKQQEEATDADADADADAYAYADADAYVDAPLPAPEEAVKEKKSEIIDNDDHDDDNNDDDDDAAAAAAAAPTAVEKDAAASHTDGTITVYNNGNGLPVCPHPNPELKHLFIPEMVFGRLLTGSNFSRRDNKKRKTGGKNGYGAKLANIFSTEFTVETGDAKDSQDADRGHLQYRQTWSDNMRIKGPRKVKKYSPKTGFTRITMRPDWKRFGTAYSKTLVDLVRTRVVEIAGTTPRSMQVEFNGEKIAIKCFRDLVTAYMGKADYSGGGGGGGESSPPKPPAFVYHKFNEDWEVAVAVSQSGGFRHVSFVNGVRTTHGGTHVNDVAKQLRKKLVESVNKMSKRFKLKEQHVQNHLSVFVNCRIVEPSFDSQTKQRLNSPVAKFGSECVITDEFCKSILKQTDLAHHVLRVVDSAMAKELKKQDKGNKCERRITGIEKLDDANEAGGPRSERCTLILTEGDSAKALAVSGLSVVGRDFYGVFPLKGKLLNVRDANHDQIMANAEVNHLKRILGLKQGVVYSGGVGGLRYGRVMIMADQDHDGSHIKGLLINLFATFWPELYRLPGFLVEFITPIVRRTLSSSSGKTFVNYYTIPEYLQWVAGTAPAEQKRWRVKYYKGLGASTSADAKRYFGDMNRHVIPFRYEDEEDDEAVDRAFNKKRADDRKKWMNGYVEGTFLNMDVADVRYRDFIDRELILFSMASNERSIPSILDGLKPGQRKIMFGSFLKRLSEDIKVAQLAGFIGEKGAYHHGEKSLHDAIVKLAQNFVGSNNLNLLVPAGQFGTRLMGGDDFASPRYIETYLDPLAFMLFPERDQPLLKNLVEEGKSIEPETYVPIIPMVLVNGAHGIGTGWSTKVYNYDVGDIVERVQYLIAAAAAADRDGATATAAAGNGTAVKKPPPPPLVPSYRGFLGTITKHPKTAHRFTTRGCMTFDSARGELHISELPVGVWTSPYKVWLEAQLEKECILDFTEYHSDTTVLYVVKVSAEDRQLLEAAAPEVPHSFYAKFKCVGSIATSNMMLFDAQGKIHKYKTPEEIIDAYFPARLDLYERRRLYELQHLETTKKRAGARIRFIEELLANPPTLDLRNKKRADISAELAAKNYPAGFNDENKSPYEYLVGMPMSSVSAEQVAKLRAQRTAANAEFAALEASTPAQIWLGELDVFMEAYNEREAEFAALQAAERLTATSRAAAAAAGKVVWGGAEEKKKKKGGGGTR